MIYLKLFLSFFQIGLFSIGGGYAALPLIKNQVVEINRWLTLKEFSDLITISQMTPGPIAINASTFVGNQVGGIPGAIIATVGCVLPSCIISLILAYLYFKYKELNAIKGILNGLRPSVVALIASAGLSILTIALLGNNNRFDIVSFLIFLVSIITIRKIKTNPIFIIIASGALALVIDLIIKI